jgi:hypothetical protein
MLGKPGQTLKKFIKTFKKNMMHFWCTFESASKWCTVDALSYDYDALLMHFQKGIKSAPKVHHDFSSKSHKNQQKLRSPAKSVLSAGDCRCSQNWHSTRWQKMTKQDHMQVQNLAHIMHYMYHRCIAVDQAQHFTSNTTRNHPQVTQVCYYLGTSQVSHILTGTPHLPPSSQVLTRVPMYPQ